MSSMTVADQLRFRMEQLNVTAEELSKRIGVSQQSVYHWLNGRNQPLKGKAAAIEKALNFKFDFTEGAAPRNAQTVQQMTVHDLQLLLAINELPQEMKVHISRLAIAFAEAIRNAEARPANPPPSTTKTKK